MMGINEMYSRDQPLIIFPNSDTVSTVYIAESACHIENLLPFLISSDKEESVES